MGFNNSPEVGEFNTKPDITMDKRTLDDMNEKAMTLAGIAARGEQPDSQAMPADGALRGDVPLSSTGGAN